MGQATDGMPSAARGRFSLVAPLLKAAAEQRGAVATLESAAAALRELGAVLDDPLRAEPPPRCGTTMVYDAKKKVIVIGSRKGSDALIEAIKQNRTLGYEVVGCLTADRQKIGSSIRGVKVLGHYKEIQEWKEKTGFDDIVCAL